MDSFIFKQVQKMRPSSFSEEERRRYQAEKMMLRQFLLMKQQDQVPDYLTVTDMQTWLLTRRSFLEEFQEIIERTGTDHLHTAEVAWTRARHLCLCQMEEELLAELDREQRLSQLLSRKVTLEGLQMFMSVVHPAAEKDVKDLLSCLHRKLLQIFGGTQLTGSSLSAEDATPVELLELERSAASLVPTVVDIALKFLLEEPEHTKSEAASAQIGILLRDSAAPCLYKFGRRPKGRLLHVCTSAARSIVKAVHQRFHKRSTSFKLMDYDDSYYTAAQAVISAIQDMEHEEQTDASSQTNLQMEEGHLEERGTFLEVTSSEELVEGVVEEREASPRLSPDEDTDSLPNDVTSFNKEETLVDCAIQIMDQEVQTAASSQSHFQLEEGLLEEEGASPEVISSEELEVSQDEKTGSLPIDVTTYRKDETLMDSAIQSMDQEVQTVASSQNHPQLEEALVEERGASPLVSLDEEIDSLPKDVTKCKKEDTLMDSSNRTMDKEVQTAASSQSHFQLEEGLLEEEGASPEVTSSEELEVSQAEETDSLPHDVTTNRKDETLVESAIQSTDQREENGVRAFFRGVWKTLTCCFSSSTMD